MKKIMLIILSTFLLIGLLGCASQKQANKKQTKELDVREVVWNQLTVKDKERIKGTWQDSKVYKRTLNENMGRINDNSYIGKEVYIIDFTTKNISIPNNMLVYASMIDYKIIGYGKVE